ncbi:hypothetical protein Tco_0319912, partial [Tanacetum coccineum]
DVLFESTSGGLNEFFLDSDEDEQIGMSRVAADPDSDDEVLAEILFRGQYISGAGVVVVDKLPDDEIVNPRVKVEPISDSASSPPRSRSKHRGVRSDNSLWDKPVEDFFSSESESDDDMATYIPPLPYGAFKDWEMVICPLSNSYYHVYYQENRRQKSFFYLKELLPHVYREDLLLLRRRMNRYFRLNPDVDVGLDLWRDVNLLCQSLHSDDVEDFWRTQDDWVVSSWKLYPKSSVHVLDLTHGKTVYMFVDKVYPIRATLLERMLRHRLTVPPSYCRDIVVAGSVIQAIQAGLRESYECLAAAPISPWLTAKQESGSPLQTALVCNSNPLLVTRLPKPGCFMYKTVDMVLNPPWNLLFLGAKGLTSPEQTATAVMNTCCKDWKLLFFNVAACFVAASYLVSAGTCFCCYSILLLREDLSRNLELTESKPIVPADSSSSIPADVTSSHWKGDVLPLQRFVKPIRVSLVYKRNPKAQCYIQTLFSTYDKVYSLKRSQKDKDKHKDPFTGSDRGLKKRKTSKDAETAKGLKAKNHSMAHPKAPSLNQNLLESLFSQMNQSLRLQIRICHKIKRRTRNDRKTPQQGPTQSWLMTLASFADKPSKTCDELMSTPIDFSAYIMNGLKITNLTQETLLGPTFRLLKGTRSNYDELEYDFEKCYKALSEKLDWENPEGGDYPFDLTKPLPLVMSRNHQKVPVDWFFNNDLKYLQRGISTMTYMTSLTETKAAQYDLPGIEDMVPNIWSPVKVAYDKHALWSISHWRDQLTQVEVMRKHGYRYLKDIVVGRAENDLYTFKEGDFPRLCINDIEDM